MSKKCLKCGYVRQESDSAPNYECPKCGVVYAKAEAVVKQTGENDSSPAKAGTNMNVTKVVLALLVIGGISYGGYSYYKSAQAKKAKEEAALALERAKVESQKKDKAKQDEVNRLLLAKVTAYLLDPGSAQFRDVQYFSTMTTLKDETRKRVMQTVCGEINAKNALGGYVGFKRFYAAAFLDSDGNAPENTIIIMIEKPDYDEKQRNLFEKMLNGCKNEE